MKKDIIRNHKSALWEWSDYSPFESRLFLKMYLKDDGIQTH